MNAWLIDNLMLADWLSDTFKELAPDKKFALIVVLVGCATGVACMAIGVFSSMLSSMHRRRLENDLKREMLDRGMSAEDIATVTEAIGPPEDATQRWIASWAKKPKRA